MDRLTNPYPSEQRLELLAGFALWLLLATGWILLSPGLTGEFLFDDIPNLTPLAEISADPSLYRLWQFLSNGLSSTIGRPLALATFALQHHSWPAHPQDFIRVNILLHLLNGALLFWALLTWKRLTNAASTAWLVPLAVTALWMLSPLQTNAVLYVVQRMAVLSGTCVLLGLLLHLKGRRAGLEARTASALALLTAGTVIGLGLGTLAKENAALYPLLVLIVEATILRTVPRPDYWKAWSRTLIGVPLVLLAAYLGYRSLGLASEYSYRSFTLSERLYTEARVLFLYLKELVFPSLYSVRILYDDLPVSRSLLHPWTTLVAVLAWVGLIGSGLRLTARAPVFSFAVLWFVAAHLLESTFLPLELAFLHRNYIAVLGPLVLLAAAGAALLSRPSLRRLRGIVTLGAIAYVLLIAFSLRQTASLWGDPKEQARFWAMRQPESRRAVLVYSGFLFRYGLMERGAAVLDDAVSRWPNDAAMKLALMHNGCFYTDLRIPSMEEMQTTLRRNDSLMAGVIGVLNRIVSGAEEGKCGRYSLTDMEAILQAASESASLAPARQNLLILLSRTHELGGNRALARDALDRAIKIDPRPDLLQQGVHWSLQGHDAARAREYLALAESSPRLKQWSYRREFAVLRELIEHYERPPESPTGE